mgnify:CR=1 FL=1
MYMYMLGTSPMELLKVGRGVRSGLLWESGMVRGHGLQWRAQPARDAAPTAAAAAAEGGEGGEGGRSVAGASLQGIRTIPQRGTPEEYYSCPNRPDPYSRDWQPGRVRGRSGSLGRGVFSTTLQ